MLRVIHNQTIAGAVLVDDVDDGLPNKTVHRLGSTANPKAYKRDGYANEPKQPCYVPRTMAAQGQPAQAGFINLNETDRVTMSAAKGKIAGFVTAGLVSVVHFTAAQLVAPVLTTADLDTPTAGAMTLTGTNFTSIAPDVSSVVITGTGAKTLTSTQITTGGGTFTATSIVIPAALIPGVAVTTSSAKVVSNQHSSAVVVVS